MVDRITMYCLVLGAAALAAVAGMSPPAHAASHRAADEHVLLIGDSIATGMYWHDSAIAILQKNLAMSWQVAVCRTTSGTGCPFLGSRPEDAVDLVGTLPEIPPYVVVELGYNDDATTFGKSVATLVDALAKRGAEHVYWLTLREARDPYPAINQILRNAAAHDPRLSIVDWDAVSAAHHEWFQADGLHLLEQGGDAMAHLIHAALMSTIAPLQPEVSQPLAACAGRSFQTRLRASGGTEPYSWRVASGRPPLGMHLLSNGMLFGDRRGSARRFSVRVTDSDGATATAAVSVVGCG